MTNPIDPKDMNFYIKARLDCGIAIEIVQRQEGVPLEVNVFPKPGTKIEDSARIVNGELHINMTTESAIGLYQLLNLILVPPKKRKKFLGGGGERGILDEVRNFFIEQDHGDFWSRYSGPFDTLDKAVLYLEALCGLRDYLWRRYRISRYDLVEVVQTRRKL